MTKSLAVVVDKLTVEGGAERVLGLILKAFPHAVLYTLNATPYKYWTNKYKVEIRTPPIGKIFVNRSIYFCLYPLACLLMRSLIIKEHTAIYYTSSCGKFVRSHASRNILYSNYPSRGIFEPHKFIQSKLILAIVNLLCLLIKPIDIMQYKKFNKIFSISTLSRDKLFEYTGYRSNVINCPTNLSVSVKKDLKIRNSFLLIGRLQIEKDIGPLVEILGKMPYNFRVIGTGPLLQKFRASKYKNLKFLGYISDRELSYEYSTAQALIFGSDIEYSLTLIEALNHGLPIIALKNKNTATMLLDKNSDAINGNVIFFDILEEKSILKAIKTFYSHIWDREMLKKKSKIFSKQIFIDNIVKNFK